MNREWCKHYRAMNNFDTCKANIPYQSIQSKAKDRPGADYPCWSHEVKGCAQAVYPTPDEVAARNREVAAMIEQFQIDLDNDICPHCKTPIQHWKQVGRCVYAEPCGDRLYQGRVPKGKQS